MASTISTFDALLKERYTDRKVEDLTMADRPLMAMIPKDEGFAGEGTKVPLIHVNPQGVGAANLAGAQANATNLVSKAFTLTAGDYYGSVDIGDKVMTFSRNNAGAFLQNKVAETDGLHEQMADSLAIHMWGNGGGALAQRDGVAVVGETFTIADPSDTYAFEEGMYIVASANDGSDPGHSLRTGETYVTAINRETGVITTEDVGDIESFGTTDYVFRRSDFFGTTGAGIIKGIGIWLYHTSASVPDLFGVIRTSDPQRLAGSRIAAGDLTGLNIEERIQLLGSRMTGRYKGPGYTHGFLNPEDWQSLAIALQSRGQRSLTDDSTRFGFQALEVSAGGKYVRIFAERYVPKGSFFGLRMQNWKLHYPEKLVSPFSGDGLTMLRKGTTADYEFRLKSYPQLSCNAPGWSGRVPLV